VLFRVVYQAENSACSFLRYHLMIASATLSGQASSAGMGDVLVSSLRLGFLVIYNHTSVKDENQTQRLRAARSCEIWCRLLQGDGQTVNFKLEAHQQPAGTDADASFLRNIFG